MANNTSGNKTKLVGEKRMAKVGSKLEGEARRLTPEEKRRITKRVKKSNKRRTVSHTAVGAAGGALVGRVGIGGAKAIAAGAALGGGYGALKAHQRNKKVSAAVEKYKEKAVIIRLRRKKNG